MSFLWSSSQLIIVVTLVCHWSEFWPKVEAAPKTTFGLSERIVVGRPYRDDDARLDNNNRIVTLDNDKTRFKHSSNSQDNERTRKVDYPEIGDHSLADLLAKNDKLGNTDDSNFDSLSGMDSLDEPNIEGK